MSIKIQIAEDMKAGDIGEISNKDGLLHPYKEKVYKWKCFGCENNCLSTEFSPSKECLIELIHKKVDWRTQ